MKIRPYTTMDHVHIAELFHRAIHSIPSTTYSQAELEAWAPTPPDYAFWKRRLSETKPLVAMMEKQIVGFIELRDGGHIDCLYVDPTQQKKGVASKLFKHIQIIANKKGMKKLSVDASKAALPFFTKQGFIVTRENRISLRNHILINYTMTLSL